MLKTFLLTLIFVVGVLSSTFAASTRIVDADSLRSSDTTKTFNLPASSGTLALASSKAQEIASGTINGVNVTFTLTNAPTHLRLYLDGAYLFPGGSYDYTISVTTITMNFAPAVGQKLTADYEY